MRWRHLYCNACAPPGSRSCDWCTLWWRSWPRWGRRCGRRTCSHHMFSLPVVRSTNFYSNTDSVVQYDSCEEKQKFRWQVRSCGGIPARNDEAMFVEEDDEEPDREQHYRWRDGPPLLPVTMLRHNSYQCWKRICFGVRIRVRTYSIAWLFNESGSE